MLVVVVFVFILGIRAFTARPMDPTPYYDAAQPMVIAHRGGAGLRPENTALAVEHAVAIGVDVVELDVRASADGVLVLMHDASVDRTTNGSGEVAELSYQELAGLDASARFEGDPAFLGVAESVPRLDAVLARWPDTRFNLEIKPESEAVAVLLCETLQAAGAQDRVLVATAHRSVALAFRAACPSVAVSAYTLEAAWFLTYHWLRLDGIHHVTAHALQLPEVAYGIDLWDARLAESARQHNVLLDIWTVNDPVQMARFLELGATGVITDRPDVALSLLGR